MESRYFIGRPESINIKENDFVEFLPISNEINTSFSFSEDVDFHDLEMFVDNYLCCHRNYPFIYIFKNDGNGYKLIKFIDIYDKYDSNDFGYDADEYPYDLYKEIINNMASYINKYVSCDVAYAKMNEEISTGNIEEPLDFYGLFLTYYGVEDTVHTRKIFGELYDTIDSNDYLRLLIATDGLVRSGVLKN